MKLRDIGHPLANPIHRWNPLWLPCFCGIETAAAASTSAPNVGNPSRPAMADRSTVLLIARRGILEAVPISEMTERQKRRKAERQRAKTQ